MNRAWQDSETAILTLGRAVGITLIVVENIMVVKNVISLSSILPSMLSWWYSGHLVGTCIIQAPSGKTPYLLHVYSYLLKAELPIYIVLYCSH